MANILVIDEMAIFREPIAASLRLAGYQTHEAANGAEAMDRLRETRTDLVLLDIALPLMGGFKFLQGLRADAALKDVPVIVLTSATDRHHVVDAAKMGAREYLLKSRFTLAEFLDRVKKHLHPPASSSPQSKKEPRSAASPAASAAESEAGKTAAPPAARTRPPKAPAKPAAPRPAVPPEEGQRLIHAAAEQAGIALLDREQMLPRIERAEIKTLPGAIAELIGLVSSPRGSVLNIAHALRNDPVLSARVLRVANSAAFTSQRTRIANLEDAVKMVGIGVVRKLVTSVGVFETVAGKDGRSMLQCWQHCLAVATLMEQTTAGLDDVAQGMPYVIGLCHDLADLILREYFVEEYGWVADLVEKTDQPQRMVEAAVFGMQYSELVTMLLARLGLPTAITSPIKEFFDRAGAKSVSSGSTLSRALRVANVYAHGLMLAPSVDESLAPLTNAECKAIFDAKLPVIEDLALRSEVLTTANVLADLPAADSQKFFEPPVPKRPLRICYVRDSEYSQLDPLHSMLKLTTEEVVLASRIPAQPSAIENIDAIVVAAGRDADVRETPALLQQLQKLRDHRELPALVLSGLPAEQCGELPPGLSIAPISISIAALGAFLAEAAAETASRNAAQK